MEDEVYKTSFTSFWKRIRETTLISIVMVLILCCFFIGDQIDLIQFVVLLIFIVAAVFVFCREKVDLIFNISFSDSVLIISGYSFNRPWSQKIEIAESTIEIRSKAKSRTSALFYLRVTSIQGVFDINRTDNWDSTSLQRIFLQFKLRKMEKVTLDEKYRLDDLMKNRSELFDV